jgi:DNA-binding PadR family transcriptional regulator
MAKITTVSLDDRQLLVLGLLYGHDWYGYELNVFLEHQLALYLPMKRPTAYLVLSGLEERGLVEAREVHEERRHTRRVYSITKQGKAAFMEELRRHLAEYHPLSRPDAIGIIHISCLPTPERLALLRQKLQSLRSYRETAEDRLRRHEGMHVYLAISHEIALLRAEERWLADLINTIEKTDSEEG